jgi:hypothetical protein
MSLLSTLAPDVALASAGQKPIRLDQLAYLDKLDPRAELGQQVHAARDQLDQLAYLDQLGRRVELGQLAYLDQLGRRVELDQLGRRVELDQRGTQDQRDQRDQRVKQDQWDRRVKLDRPDLLARCHCIWRLLNLWVMEILLVWVQLKVVTKDLFVTAR